MKHLISLFFLSIILTSCGLLKKQPLKNLVAAEEKGPYDAIIVPGTPYDGLSWDQTMNMRVQWSLYLYENGYAKNIIYSGSSVYTKYYEAKVMALHAIELGIPAEHIFVDTLAEHSTENVYYSYQVAKEQGFENIALATDPFQNNALKSFIKKYELPVDHLPAVFDSISPPSSIKVAIQPKSTINHNFVALPERESFFKRFSGTLGKNIAWHEEDLPNAKLIRKHGRQGRLIPSANTSAELGQ